MIPKIIHQMNSSITEDVLSSVDSISKTNPEWEHKFWFDESVDALIKTELPDYYNYWSKWDSKNIGKWDIARYLLLYLEGGLYADIDMLFYKPLCEIVDLEKSLIFRGPVTCWNNKAELEPLRDPKKKEKTWQELWWVRNHFMLSEPKHPFWLYLVDGIINEKKKSRSPHARTGGWKMGAMLQEYVDEDHINLAGIQFLDRNYIINKKLWYEPPWPNTRKKFDPSLVYAEHFVKKTWGNKKKSKTS